MKVWLARDESGALFIHRHKPEQRRYDRQGVVWESTDYWQLYHRDYPEVTFENSPIEAEFKLRLPKKPKERKIEYEEFEGVVEYVYSANRTFNDWMYQVRGKHPLLQEYAREFKVKQGVFKVSTAPGKGDRVLLRYRKTKKRSGKNGREVFDFINAKIIKVL